MKLMRSLCWVILPALLLASSALAQEEKPKRNASAPGAKVYIVRPTDGKTVKRKFKVIFGLTGMGICPAGLTAGDGTPFPNSGHHHLLIDHAELPALDVPLIGDKPTDIMHFGKGQNGGHARPAARKTYAAADLCRLRPCAAQSACDFKEDHRDRWGLGRRDLSTF